MTAARSRHRRRPWTSNSWLASTSTSAPTRASVRHSGRPRRCGPDDRAIQDALFAGWAEVGPLTTDLSADEIAEWLAQRRAYLAAGRSSLRVGHVDIFVRLIGSR